ncbi:MAG: transposase family protein [Xanthomonadales bacterium]|nr:transposase family protein [Xanthomonadales bacterium]
MRSCGDAIQTLQEASARRVPCPRFPAAGGSEGRVRRPAGAGRDAGTALKKTRCGACGREQSGWYDRRTRRVRDMPCGPYRIFLEFEVRRVRCPHCQAVKREALDFLSDSAFYTKRFAYYVGRRCRNESIAAVAKELHLDWDSVKTLESST